MTPLTKGSWEVTSIIGVSDDEMLAIVTMFFFGELWLVLLLLLDSTLVLRLIHGRDTFIGTIVTHSSFYFLIIILLSIE